MSTRYVPESACVPMFVLQTAHSVDNSVVVLS